MRTSFAISNDVVNNKLCLVEPIVVEQNIVPMADNRDDGPNGTSTIEGNQYDFQRVYNDFKEARMILENDAPVLCKAITPTNLMFKFYPQQYHSKPRIEAKEITTRSGVSYDDSIHRGGGKESEMTKGNTELRARNDIQNSNSSKNTNKDKEPIEKPYSLLTKAKPTFALPVMTHKQRFMKKMTFFLQI
ncbi:hypothetical protein Tco_0123505 [Tanacetum coccineum]